jgi:hypothetical protein
MKGSSDGYFRFAIATLYRRHVAAALFRAHYIHSVIPHLIGSAVSGNCQLCNSALLRGGQSSGIIHAPPFTFRFYFIDGRCVARGVILILHRRDAQIYFTLPAYAAKHSSPPSARQDRLPNSAGYRDRYRAASHPGSRGRSHLSDSIWDPFLRHSKGIV